MKKKALSFLALLMGMFFLTASTATAQVADSFYLKMTHIFQNVETNRASTGLLKDYGIDFVNVSDYDGVQVSNNNIMYVNTWDDLYTSLYTYRFNSVMAGMTHPDLVFDAINTAASGGKVPLSLLLMQYDAYLENALAAGLVTVAGDQVFDKYTGGVWQNPYQQKTAMGVRAGSNIIKKQSMVFRLPAALLYSNFSSIQSIEADFADGIGWRAIATDTDIPVSYADSGKKVLQFRVTLTNSQQYNSRTAIGVYPPPNSSGTAREFEHLSIPIAATANHSGGTMEIHFSEANSGTRAITRPLIIAEGFDAWKYVGNNESANTVFDDFWRQRDNSPQLQALLEEDYDIIYLDYTEGTDDIMRNAALLTAVINEVNIRKAAAASTEPNVVLGISMGGLVSRIALRQMEINGQNHQTRLFVSLDAPHLGANVPLGLQALNTHLASTQLKVGLVSGSIGYVSTVGSVAKALQVYSTTAARQLLTYYVKANVVNGSLAMDNSFHNSFMTTLTTLGYPVNSRNVSISNGSECAQSLPITPGSDLLRLSGNYSTSVLGSLALPMIGLTVGTLSNYPQFLIDLFPGPTAVKCDFVVRTTPASGSAQVYNGRVWLEKKILFFINVSQNLTTNSYNSPSGVLPLDAFPGGQYAVNQVGEQIMQNFNGDFGTSFWQEIQNATFNRGINLFMAGPSFTFTPTAHVLDIGQGITPLVAADYTTQYRATAPPVAPKNTPFANFITEFNNGDTRNQDHTDLFRRSGNWLAGELNALPFQADCNAFCTRVIEGPGVFCASQPYTVTLAAGSTVTWQANPAGIVSMVAAGNQVTLTRIGNGAFTLTATIQGACGNFTINRGLLVGSPMPEWISVQVDFTNKIIARAEVVPGATAYRWYLENVLVATTVGPSRNMSMGNVACGVEKTLGIEAVTPCGTSPRNTWPVFSQSCNGAFKVSPNPAANQVVVEVDTEEENKRVKEIAETQSNVKARQSAQGKQTKKAATANYREHITEVKLIDIQGKVLKQQKYAGDIRRVSLDVTGLTAGNYFVLIYNGHTWTSKPIVVVK